MSETIELRKPDQELIRAAVKEALLALGIEACDPVEMQRDFAYLRRWRVSSEKIGVGARIAIIGASCTAIVSMVGLIIGYVVRGNW